MASFDASVEVASLEVLPSPVPGSPYRALAIAAGSYHACALLDDHTVKCWGMNDYGQLGLGDKRARGVSAAEMGDALPAVDLGVGRTANAIAAGRYATCAILDDDAVKCWGYSGQTGSGVGDAVVTVDLGSGRKAKRVAMGYYLSCAEVDDGTVRCWPGSSAPTTFGFPEGRRIVELTGAEGVMALLEGGQIASFGSSSGLVANVAALKTIAGSRTLACGVRVEGGIDCVPSMPWAAPPPEAMPVELAVTEQKALCGRLRDGRVACWTRGSWSDGDTNVLDSGYIVPLKQPAVSLAGGGVDHACAVLADGGVKCWSWRGADAPVLGASLPDGTYADWRAIDLGTHPAR